MVLKNISPGCGVRASLMLFFLIYNLFFNLLINVVILLLNCLVLVLYLISPLFLLLQLYYVLRGIGKLYVKST